MDRSVFWRGSEELTGAMDSEGGPRGGVTSDVIDGDSLARCGTNVRLAALLTHRKRSGDEEAAESGMAWPM